MPANTLPSVLAASPAHILASLRPEPAGSSRGIGKSLLDDPFGFEIADLVSAVIEVQRQCRRALGSPSRDSRPGDGRASNGDGLSHRVSLLLRRGRILRL
jgi:hypothetical protein